MKLRRRLSEASTWATLTGAFAGLAATTPPAIAAWCWAGVVVSTILGVLIPERTTS